MKKGMTLIEIVVVLAILSILAATLVPSVGTQIKRARIEATRAEMLRLKDALLAFYKDVQQVGGPNAGRFRFPANLTQLETNPGAGFTGWRGPYIVAGFDVQDYTQDEWRRNYQYTDAQVFNDNFCLLRSAGSDNTFGNADDIVITVDATTILNEKIDKTRQELEVIKQAAQQSLIESSNPPPPRSYPANLNDLLNNDYISPEFEEDEWGNPYRRQTGAATVSRRFFYSFGPNCQNESGGNTYATGPGGDDIFP